MLLFLVFSHSVLGQKYISRYNHVSFYSEAPLEDIEAHTYNSSSVFDLNSSRIVFAVPIRTFEFEKSLMQEHFNENYMESAKYPKAKFSGNVVGFKKDTVKQQVTAEGILEIHGVKKQVSVPGEIDFSDQEIKISSKFIVKVSDYGIEIPHVVRSNIAKEIEISIEFTYSLYENQ